MRTHYTWTLPQGSISLGQRTIVMGILNLTPDSFSDGGVYNEPAKAVARALEIEENRYGRYERAEVEPNLALLCRMCEVLQVLPNDLLGWR